MAPALRAARLDLTAEFQSGARLLGTRARSRLHSRLQERLERIPGVRAATFSRVPLLAGTRANRRTIIPGYTPPAGASMNININGVAPNFFAAMEIPLVLGRSFTARDDEKAPAVAIVTQAFARRYCAGENPVGRG